MFIRCHRGWARGWHCGRAIGQLTRSLSPQGEGTRAPGQRGGPGTGMFLGPGGLQRRGSGRERGGGSPEAARCRCGRGRGRTARTAGPGLRDPEGHAQHPAPVHPKGVSPCATQAAGGRRGGGGAGRRAERGARGEVSAARCLLSGAVGLWPPPRNPEGAASATGLPACPAPRPCRPGSARDRCELPRRLAPARGASPSRRRASGLPGCRGSPPPRRGEKDGTCRERNGQLWARRSAHVPGGAAPGVPGRFSKN